MAGLNAFVKDIEFMLNIKLSRYWKITWAYITPLTLMTIFAYAMATYTRPSDGDYLLPDSAIGTAILLPLHFMPIEF